VAKRVQRYYEGLLGPTVGQIFSKTAFVDKISGCKTNVSQGSKIT
jgi:hypothetical protein